MEGESIAPTSDRTMSVVGIGSGGRRSIDPTDYMGQAFVYEEWAKKRVGEIKKDIEKKQEQSTESQDIKNIVRSVNETILPAEKQEISSIEQEKENVQESMEFKQWKAEQERAKKEHKETEMLTPAALRPTAGAIPIKVFALDKYNKDLIEKKNAIEVALKKIEDSRSLKDLNAAREELDKAQKEYKDVVNTNPASVEGKEKYKDEWTTQWVEPVKYAQGFGLGGYFGFTPGGKENVGLKDQLAANILGVQVGSAKPVVQMTPEEMMASQGFSARVNPVTGGTNYYNNKGEMFSGDLSKLTQYKYMDTSNARELVNSMNKVVAQGGRINKDQAQDIYRALISKSETDKMNILQQKITAYTMNPTRANLNEAINYQNSLGYEVNKEAQRLAENIKLENKMTISDILKEKGIIAPRIGSVAGLGVYGSKTGSEFVKLPSGETMSLSDLTSKRQQASMTGEFNVYNYPTGTFGGTLRDISAGAKQWLYQNVPGYTEKVTAPAPKIGTVKIDGKSLDVVRKANEGEFVKLNTGNEVPLNTIMNLSQMASGTGIYARNPSLRDAQVDYIKAYKEYNIYGTEEAKSKVLEAGQKLASMPEFDTEIGNQLQSILNMGGKYAGMNFDENTNRWVPSDNIIKGILQYSANTPVQNAVKIGILTQEDAEKPIFQDLAKGITKRGADPIEGLERAKMFADVYENKQVYAMTPDTPGYNANVDALIKIATKDKSLKTYELPYLSQPFKPATKSMSGTFGEKSFDTSGIRTISKDTSGFEFAPINSPTIVSDPTKVYVNPANINATFKKSRSGVLAVNSTLGLSNITGLQFRKSKQSKPKMNIKKNVVRKKVITKNPIMDIDINLEKMIGNISGTTDMFNKKNKMINGIDLKPMVNITLPKFKKMKK